MKIKRKNLNLHWLLLIILGIGTLFYSSKSFIVKEILPKEYVFIFCSYLLGISFLYSRKPIRIDWFTVVIILFVLYLLLVSVFTSSSVIGYLCLTGFLLLLFYFKENSHLYKYINCTLVILCIFHALYGLLQYFHIIRFSSGFPMLGSYDNPAGFTASLAVSFPLCFSLLRYSKIYKKLTLLSIAIIGLAIILSESRTGIISIIIVSSFFFPISIRVTKRI